MDNKITKKDLEKFFEKAGQIKSIDELFGRDGPPANLVKGTVEGMPEAEMTNHLGYPKDCKFLVPGINNKRNGHSRKRLKTSSGKRLNIGKTQIHRKRTRQTNRFILL